MRYVARDCKFVIAWLFGVIWGAYAFAEAIPNQLMQLWSSQREEIASCKLTYHSFLQMDEQIKPLSRVELHNLMEETRPWESPSDLSGFLSSLVSDAYTLPTLYVTRTFVKDGERYSWRSDESNTDEIRSDGILQSTKRVRGEYKDIVIRHEGLLNGQAILERLRIIPWPKNMAAGDWQITMEGTHSDLVLPSNDGSGFRTEWKVDSLTGSVLSRTVSSATEGVVRELFCP